MSQTDFSDDVYGVSRWGKGLITVLPNGDVALTDPLHENAPAISLPEIISDLENRGIASPMVLRVGSFLEHEIKQINESFAAAIDRAGYKAPIAAFSRSR